jgi:phosphate transport system substrate-binding protein
MSRTSDSVRRPLKSILTFLCGFGLLAGIFSVAGCGGGDRLSGGGATFVDPIVQKWAAEYKKVKGVSIDYVKSGSGDGIRQMVERTNDFGCSDAPMNKKEIDSAKEPVLNVPIIMGSVAVIYNVPGLTKPLVLSGPVLADIYLGKIPKWDDEAIAKLNPGAKLPNSEIIPVGRAEGSGTSFIFTDYLSKVSPEFKKRVGASKDPKWVQEANVLRQKGSDGVSGHVQRTEGTIGYVELFYSESNRIPAALMLNQSNKAVAPNAEGVVAAAEAALGTKPTEEPYSLHEHAYALTNMPGEKSYPIAGMSFLVLYKKQPEGKGKALKDFLHWATTDGQQYAESLSYAPLPKDLQEKLKPIIDSIELSK